MSLHIQWSAVVLRFIEGDYLIQHNLLAEIPDQPTHSNCLETKVHCLSSNEDTDLFFILGESSLTIRQEIYSVVTLNQKVANGLRHSYLLTTNELSLDESRTHVGSLRAILLHNSGRYTVRIINDFVMPLVPLDDTEEEETMIKILATVVAGMIEQRQHYEQAMKFAQLAASHVRH